MTLKERWHQHNKQLKRWRQSKITFDEYLVYISGKTRYKEKTLPKEAFTPKQYYRESPNVPSVGTGVGVPLPPKQQNTLALLFKVLLPCINLTRCR